MNHALLLVRRCVSRAWSGHSQILSFVKHFDGCTKHILKGLRPAHNLSYAMLVIDGWNVLFALSPAGAGCPCNEGANEPSY